MFLRHYSSTINWLAFHVDDNDNNQHYDDGDDNNHDVDDNVAALFINLLANIDDYGGADHDIGGGGDNGGGGGGDGGDICVQNQMLLKYFHHYVLPINAQFAQLFWKMIVRTLICPQSAESSCTEQPIM